MAGGLQASCETHPEIAASKFPLQGMGHGNAGYTSADNDYIVVHDRVLCVVK